jgi:hypothetical protein
VRDPAAEPFYERIAKWCSWKKEDEEKGEEEGAEFCIPGSETVTQFVKKKSKYNIIRTEHHYGNFISSENKFDINIKYECYTFDHVEKLCRLLCQGLQFKSRHLENKTRIPVRTRRR